MNLVKSISAAALLALGSIATAHADTVGSDGQVAALRIYESSSDEYSTERGSLYLNEGGGVIRKYQWGGQACNGRNLIDINLSILSSQVANRLTKLVPTYKTGGGGVRCLTGYWLQDAAVYIY